MPMKGNENRRVAIRLGKTDIAEHAQAALKHASFESGMVEHLVKSELRRDRPLPSSLPRRPCQTRGIVNSNTGKEYETHSTVLLHYTAI